MFCADVSTVINEHLEVTVAILTLNAGPEFSSVLDMVVSQRTTGSFQVLVVDSGSTDGTVELARDAGARVLSYPGSFRHGAARNWASGQARGDYVAYLVQDAIPLDAAWLESLLQPLRTGSMVAASYSRQIPRPDSDPLTRRQLANWITAGTRRRVTSGRSALEDETPAALRARYNFDNVSSCVRRSVLERFPFPEVEFAEDLAWAKQVLDNGHQIVYEPLSAVIHSHNRTLDYERVRASWDAEAVSRLWGDEVGLSDPESGLLDAALQQIDYEWQLVRERVLHDPDLSDPVVECRYWLEELEHAAGTAVSFHDYHLSRQERLALGFSALLKGPANLAGRVAGLDRAGSGGLEEAYRRLLGQLWGGRWPQ